jgi:hypothetical protein
MVTPVTRFVVSELRMNSLSAFRISFWRPPAPMEKKAMMTWQDLLIHVPVWNAVGKRGFVLATSAVPTWTDEPVAKRAAAKIQWRSRGEYHENVCKRLARAFSCQYPSDDEHEQRIKISELREK